MSKDGSTAGHHLAQINIARAVSPMDDPRLADFVARLDDINDLAERSPGFVWRLQSGSGNATDIQAYDDPNILVNLTVWDSLESLFDYVYRSGHAKVMARRKEWFERMPGPYTALWWVPAGHRPSVEEGKERLDHLSLHGPSPWAFSFKQSFPSADGICRALSKDEADKARCA